MDKVGWVNEATGVKRLAVAVVDVAGEDARAWLNGQVTHDVALLPPGESRYALIVTTKGKVRSDVWISAISDERFQLVLPEDRADEVIEAFDTQIIMEDVELERLKANVVTLQGPRSNEALKKSGLTGAPADRLGTGGFDVVAPTVEVETSWARLVSAAESLGGGAMSDSDWELAHLRAVIPRFGVDFDERNYPQEAGLTRALSFTKGCYVGQEVVCTLENRGQLSKRLVALEVDGPVPPPDQPIELEGRKVGRITTAVEDRQRHKTLALAYLKRAHAEVGHELPLAQGTARVSAIAGAPGQLASGKL